jgi:hypothetical protein
MFGITRWSPDRRSGGAVPPGLTAPVLVMALGSGIAVSRWSVASVQLQSIADTTAFAGAFDYEHQSTPVLPPPFSAITPRAISGCPF